MHVDHSVTLSGANEREEAKQNNVKNVQNTLHGKVRGKICY